jgi:hypothetical protein
MAMQSGLVGIGGGDTYCVAGSFGREGGEGDWIFGRGGIISEVSCLSRRW